MFWVITGLGAAAYLGGAIAIAMRQRAALAPTHRDPQGAGDATFQPWRAPHGEFLGYFRDAEQPRRLVLFFHGAGGEALDRAWVSEVVPAQDVLVLAEYPGFGACPGRATDANWLAQAEKLVEEARDRWGGIETLAVGENLGCSVVAGLAEKGKVDRIAMISPFPSGSALTPGVYRFFPSGWRRGRRLNVEAPLQTVKSPLQIVHGTLDARVPVHQGRAVFQAYTGPHKGFEEVPGFDHTNMDQAVLHSPFTSRFREFLAN